MCYIGSSIPRCTLMELNKKGKISICCSKESTITIRNEEALSAVNEASTHGMRCIAIKTKRRGVCRAGNSGVAELSWNSLILCETVLLVEDGVCLCCSYLMNVFSVDLAVGDRGLGASAHIFPRLWKEHIDIARRVKVGIGSFRLSRSARELLKKHVQVCRK
jgi:hypothetical protein